MANPTSAFGWQMPTSTDLVTDLPADFEVFGQAVDTSLADLKGGTTGQVLSKATNADMDFTWVTTDDANAIQNSIVDAKGDLIAASANDTPARLAVGANGTVLTADSAEVTGLKWATPASGSTFAGAYVTNSTNPSIANNTLTTLAFNTESYDTNAYHDNSTNNSRLTIPSGKGGYYLITAIVQWDVNATGRRELYIAKNGTLISGAEVTASAAAYPKPNFSMPFALAVGDYVEVKLYQSSGGNLTAYDNVFTVSYLGA